MYKYILFDLDGTLTDSAPGILRCVQYALEKSGRGHWQAEDLLCFIGPPLVDSFQSCCGMSKEEAVQATAYYRERYTSVGMYENSVYPGIPQLLEQLAHEQKILAVATSKPALYARQILEHFDLARYFTYISGPGFKGELPTKALVIADVLARLRLDSPEAKASAIMIGDRKYDGLGAKTNGLACLGALYGYGTPDELAQAGMTPCAAAPEELAPLLLAPPCGK